MTTLPTINAAFGNVAYWPLPTGKGTGGEAQPITGNAVIDRYDAAWVAVNPVAHQLIIQTRPNGVPVGGSLTVTVTMNANSQDGTALPALQRSVVFQGAPPPPPQAVTQDVVGNSGSIPAVQISPALPDPGSALVTY